MKKIILSCLFVWFLVIQHASVDNSFAYSIPMQDENHCVRAIEVIKIKVKNERYEAFLIPQYTCVDVGNV